MEANQKLKTLTPAQYAFMRWLAETHPSLLQLAEERRASLNGFMDSLSNVFNTVMEKAPDLLKQYVTSQEQVAQLKANIERAKAGQYPQQYVITPQAPSSISMPSGQTLAIAALGAIAVYLLLKR